MSGRKKLLLIFLSIITVLMLISVWYNYTYSMDEAVAQEVNSPNYTDKLLVATQGSTFKDAITANIINEYKEDSIFIKVVDVSYLSKINPDEYKAIVIVHTWENWKPPVPVKLFIEEKGQRKDKIIVLTTSGEGSYKMDDVDAITGASKPENIAPFTDRITERIDKLLHINSN